MHDKDHYQWQLRALGAFLDTQQAQFVSLIETRNGFGVRYYQHREDVEPTFVFVEEPQLRALAEALRTRRRLPNNEVDGVQLLGPITTSGKYQDFFRALGWELDDLVAASIVLDEQEDGVFLAYAYRDAQTDLFWRKRVATLRTIEQQEILRDALKRRKQ